jgi:adenylate cyclase, class 2
MRYEVEQKHPVADARALVARLQERGVSLGEPIDQSDQYFAHPCRDFAKTDEALRIRTVGDNSFVTYKGPKLDAKTKTRREIELPLDPDDADGSRFAELLAALGFTSVATVDKKRRAGQLSVDDREIEFALDDVEGLGSFIELELQADDSNLEAAKQAISKLALELDLGPSERRSYLEMLLEKKR